MTCGVEIRFSIAFQVLYGIACEKNTSVATNMEMLRGSNQWNMSFTKVAHDWEFH